MNYGNILLVLLVVATFALLGWASIFEVKNCSDVVITETIVREYYTQDTFGSYQKWEYLTESGKLVEKYKPLLGKEVTYTEYICN